MTVSTISKLFKLYAWILQLLFPLHYLFRELYDSNKGNKYVLIVRSFVCSLPLQDRLRCPLGCLKTVTGAFFQARGGIHMVYTFVTQGSSNCFALLEGMNRSEY
jgi:hypothetical protein